MKIHDVLGVGFGPANLSLAIALEELTPGASRVFLDRSKEVVWQKDMLFENALDLHSNIQNIPHRDLATPRNPRSRYTFLNYLHENGLFFKHLNMDLLMPMRPEYARYIGWVAGLLDDVFEGGKDVDAVRIDDEVDAFKVECRNGDRYFARNIVLGTGRPPHVPAIFERVASPNVVHFTRYLSSIERMAKEGVRSVAVVGSSQTAAEIMLHITKQYPQMSVDGIMRRFGFPLKDTSPFMSEIYFPEFTDAYFNASPELKARFDKDVRRTNYGAADLDVIEEIYKQVYHDTLSGTNKLLLHRMTDITHVGAMDSGKVSVEMRHHLKGEDSVRTYDGIVLATGFQNFGPREGDIAVPSILKHVSDALVLDRGAIAVQRDYSIRMSQKAPGKIFMNGLSESMHGMGDAGSLSLASIRAQDIATAMSKAGLGETASPRVA